MRTEIKRGRKILTAIIMITHSRSIKTLRCNSNYKVLNTDLVQINFNFSGKKVPISYFMHFNPICLWIKTVVAKTYHTFLKKCQKTAGTDSWKIKLIKNLIQWQHRVSWLLHTAATFNVVCNEKTTIVSGLSQRALIWMMAAGLRGRERARTWHWPGLNGRPLIRAVITGCWRHIGDTPEIMWEGCSWRVKWERREREEEKVGVERKETASRKGKF